MNKSLTIIISDLHLGVKDKNDDHVHQGKPLVRMLDEFCQSDQGKKGDIELFINGDFFELAQVMPEIYAGDDFTRWASEDESLIRLQTILRAHADIFAALKKFKALGNTFTMAAGNHDVDLYWSKVQQELNIVIGLVKFETGSSWYFRYDGRLLIAHGHMDDPANKFENWQNPIKTDTTPSRLEMCPGTLFMLKIVNILENDYPFVDNIKPVTALARLFWNKSKWEFAGALWLLIKFRAKHKNAALSTAPSNLDDFQKKLKQAVSYSGSDDCERIRQLAAQVYGAPQSDHALQKLVATEASLEQFMLDVLRHFGLDGLKKLNYTPSSSLSVGGGKGTLAIQKEGKINEKTQLQEIAEAQFKSAPNSQVIVIGHTHQPDTQKFTVNGHDKYYYNPGSWTRYADINDIPDLTLDDLKDESKFPYQLNYVRIEDNGDGTLRSEMIVFEEDECRIKTK
jgi:UDP-2,3-diacylglucosamine pyrophosphatase LpxH